MIYLLYFAIAYLLVITVIMIMNLRDFIPMPTVDFSTQERPLVSICIPARNEEQNIERSVLSALNQEYSLTEVIVLDDESTDQTSQILHAISKKYPEKLSIINGKPKPDSWLGKSWACHQLSQYARGNILFFIDADVQLSPKTVHRAVQSMHHFSVEFITVWPLQHLGTFWERVVIPIIYYGLLGLLPARYVHQKPWWLPAALEKRISPAFAAANGQCMIFKKSAYKAIGGHESVKNNIVEDVALAKQIKVHGFSMRMFHGERAASCRMYRSATEMWHGFRKNFLALFNNSVPVFILMAVINFVVYILPLIALILGLFIASGPMIILSAFTLLLMTVHRIILARWYNWEKKMALLHPLGVLWFHALGIRVLWDHFTGKHASWKDRPTT